MCIARGVHVEDTAAAPFREARARFNASTTCRIAFTYTRKPRDGSIECHRLHCDWLLVRLMAVVVAVLLFLLALLLSMAVIMVAVANNNTHTRSLLVLASTAFHTPAHACIKQNTYHTHAHRIAEG